MLEPRSLLDLIKSVDQDNLVVPDFQRGFKWKSANIRKLLESLLLDYPIGSALIWKTKRSALAYRSINNIEFSEENDNGEVEEQEAEQNCFNENERTEEVNFILDGQQRITSIYRLFPANAAPSSNEVHSKMQGLRFFLDLDKLGLNKNQINANEDDYLVKRRFRDPDIISDSIVEKRHADLRKEYRRLHTGNVPQLLEESQILEICRQNKWLPLTRSFLENEGRNLREILKITRAELTHGIDSEQERQINDQMDLWSDCFTSTIQSVLNKKVLPCLILKSDIPEEGLARIFETVNSTGMSLSIFDLLVAKLGNWPVGSTQMNLRKLLEETFKNDNRQFLKRFDDGQELGGTISQQVPRILALRADIELNKGNILKAKRGKFIGHIDGLSNSLKIALTTIEEMGVLDQSYIPIKDWISIIGAINSNNWEKQKQKVISFLWAVCFSENWESSTNETVRRIYKDLVNLVNHETTKVDVLGILDKQFPLFDDLIELNSKSTIGYRALMAFNLSRGGFDWCGLKRDLSSPAEMEDHHIFPQKWISSNRVQNEDKTQWNKLRDCILNRMFVSRKANLDALDSSPPNYLGKLSEENRRILQIPDSFNKKLTTPMKLNTFKQLLKDRYDLMREDFITTVAKGSEETAVEYELAR